MVTGLGRDLECGHNHFSGPGDLACASRTNTNAHSSQRLARSVNEPTEQTECNSGDDVETSSHTTLCIQWLVQ